MCFSVFMKRLEKLSGLLGKKASANKTEADILWKKMRRIGRRGQDVALSDFVVRDREEGHSVG